MTALNMEQRLLGRYHLDHELCAEIRRLIAENKRYREALEFYADKDNWHYDISLGRWVIIGGDCGDTGEIEVRAKCGGYRAREALNRGSGKPD